ncbi:penicillin amidase [Acrocarpospora phusangensis]|uniref:Penicillin amidase n=1 Tax=Acrocarpospora phusangensis TaxID=1070424 RepID=A0A919QAG7_9ACTN|nr:penicillin acylase family protein [Acrocarpospora phusangensis]GIH24441.1 penicillin amidase [Acrocarpospora phusangensis]
MVKFAPFARFAWPIRWLFRVLTVLLVLAVVLAGAGTWVVRQSFPQTDGQLALPGLTAPVTVYRDAHGIPQIFADTPDDLFRAQGYTHAQDRFWEMDFRRKTTAGRLSELFGSATLDIDKVVRTLGWRRVAEQELALLTPEARRALDAYAAGVNAWLTQHDGFGSRSLEYAVLALTNGDYTPEPWTPADSLAWLKAMAWDLRSNMDEELERALDASVLPVERVNQLFPAYPFDRHQPIVGTGSVKDGEFDPGAPTVAATSALRRVSEALRKVPSLIGTEGTDRKGIGSNSWVVSGEHTDTGKPLLANDPHLGPRIPSIWYQAGLHCRTRSAACPYDVSGYTFSGLPGVVIGHNHRIAWGFTNLGSDVSDLYVERVKGDTYEVEGTWTPLQTRTERIKVAGGAPVDLKVRSTKHGPIISEVYESATDALSGAVRSLARPPAADQGIEHAVALRWTALDPGQTANSMVLLNKAENWDQFRAAAALFEAPAQNLIYADVDGNIGYQAPGKIPVRSEGNGQWPAAGWTGEQEWTGYIPFAELPYAYNPPEGFIATANNAAIAPGNGPFLTSDWAYGYRSQRIVTRIEDTLAAGKMTAAKMGEIQMDSAHGFAPLLVPHLTRLVGRGTELFESWHFQQDRDSAAAAYFNVVWKNLLARVFDDELPEGARPTGGDRWFEIMRTLLEDEDSAWWDDVRTKNGVETRDDILRAALADADAEIGELLGDDPAGWRWGDLHTLDLTHETFGTSGIAPIEALFNRGPLSASGGKDAVNATGWDSTEGYAVNWVPSMRMVVDLADLDRSRWVNLTGASGHAYHPNYADQAELWANGETTPWPSTEKAVKAAATQTLTLHP